MKTYEKYKDSGVEWIGEIPEHWECKMIKRLSPIKRGASPRPIDNPIYFDNNGEYSWVRIADVSASERYLEYTEQTLSELGASLSVKRNPGDFFLSIAGTVGKPIITKIKCCIHDGFVYFPNLKINPEYLYYIFTTGMPYKGLGKWGTQLNLNTDTVGDIYIPVPLDNEIESQINFLDRKTAEIDRIIANKQKLIALYEEEKQAIINQAVTKGLDPNVKLKDSGVEWLGEIPEHWEVKRIRQVAKIFGRIGYRGYTVADLVSEGEGAITISPSNMKDYHMDFSSCTYLSWEKYEESPEIKISNGDILFVKTGSTYGKTSYVSNLPMEATINPQIIVFKEIDCNNKLLWYNLKSENIIFQVEGTVVGGTIPTISQAKISNYYFPISPEFKEQQSIVAYLEKECNRLDIILEKCNKQIDLLKEYRTTLISEVVTGKIKVC